MSPMLAQVPTSKMLAAVWKTLVSHVVLMVVIGDRSSCSRRTTIVFFASEGSTTVVALHIDDPVYDTLCTNKTIP